ncbi:MAG: glycosyltransferase family 39 protein [Gammaproteobacteria bacterium]|nr:glycosyltransferase family 39 protein [Gammaproteobacteria bacterium]
MSTDTNNKPYWLFWIVLAVMAAVFPVFAWHENTAGFLTDDGMYLLMADFFSPYYNANHHIQQFIIVQARFPPAFPVLIALFGGGSANMAAAHLVTCATFLVSGVMLYLWARRTLASRELAVACLAIYALLPKTLVYVTEIWSEFLYMALVLAVLVLLDIAARSASPRRVRETLCAAALFIGVAVLTRTIGVALFAAFLVFLVLHPVRQRYLYVLIAVSLPVFWQVVKAVNGYGGGYTEDLEKYFSMSGIQVLLLDDIPANASLLLASWGRHFALTPAASWPLQAASLLLLILALAGAAQRAMNHRPDVHYAAVYLVIVLVWPYPEHNTRFLYPLIPLVLVYLFIGANLIAGAAGGPVQRHARAALVLGLLALVYPNAVFVVDRFHEPVPDHIPGDYRHTRHWLRGHDIERIHHEADQKATVIRLLQRTRRHFGRRQCVYSAHPISTMLYSDRISIIVPRTVSIERLWVCRYLIAVNLRTVYEPNYPLHDVDRDRLRLLDAERDHRGVPQAFLFEINR